MEPQPELEKTQKPDNKDTEHRSLHEGKYLRAPQAYGFLFQCEPYDDSLKSIMSGVLKEWISSSGVIGSMGIIESSLEDLRELEIKAENVHTIVFNKNSNLPTTTIATHLFNRSHYPMAIKLSNTDQLKKLENELRSNNDLTDNAEFAGSLLLSTTLGFDFPGGKKDIYKGSIAIGVVDKITSKPQGIVFCPEGMLDYDFVDHESGRKRKKIVEVSSLVKNPLPIGVKI